METSADIGKISPAFVKAQAACNGAKKASNNPHFKSKYADLTQVWAACEDALQANGLSVIQGLGEVADNKMAIDTMLLHESGQWIKSRASIPLPKSDPQGYGSASTYARRYTLAAMMGIVQEDDDGNAAMPRKADQVIDNLRNAPPQKGNAGHPDWPAGPHKGISALKTYCRTLWRDIASAPDCDSLDALLVSEKDTINQIRMGWPDGWNGDGGDNIGFGALIAKRQTELAAEAAGSDPFPIAGSEYVTAG